MISFDEGAVPSQVPLYTILRTEDTAIVGGPAISTRGKRVWFRTARGDQSYIEVPLSDFNAETVNAAIMEAVKHIYMVGDLQGPMVSVD